MRNNENRQRNNNFSVEQKVLLKYHILLYIIPVAVLQVCTVTAACVMKCI